MTTATATLKIKPKAGKPAPAEPAKPQVPGGDIRCQRRELMAALRLVQQATGKGFNQPLLAMTHLAVKADHLRLAATDLEMAISLRVPATTDALGVKAMISTPRLLAILGELDDAEVLFRCQDGQITLLTDCSEFQLRTADVEEFPTIPAFPHEAGWTVKTEALRTMLGRTLFSAERLEGQGRYGMEAVEMSWKPGRLDFVTTDGKRLSHASTNGDTISGPALVDGKVLVLARHLRTLLRLLAHQGAEQIDLAIDNCSAYFRAGETVFHCRLLDKKYPNYQSKFDECRPVKVTLPVDLLHQAVRQVSIMSEQDCDGIVCHFHKGKVTLSLSNTFSGRATVDVPLPGGARCWSKKNDLTLRLPADHLTDLLTALDGEEQVELEASENERTAVLFRAGQHFTHLVMPLTQ
jgi:DNA polymerase-3 subunit beta